jgi:hypothetical protein
MAFYGVVDFFLFLPYYFFMKQSCFFVFLFFLISCSWAQKNVHYNIEEGINSIESQYIKTWQKIKKIDGFRIQITSFAGINSKTSIEKVANQFQQQFPNIPIQISYSEPNFRLRVGNYPTKLEAYKALQAIAPSFPGAFVLKDQIDFK